MPEKRDIRKKNKIRGSEIEIKVKKGLFVCLFFAFLVVLNSKLFILPTCLPVFEVRCQFKVYSLPLTYTMFLFPICYLRRKLSFQKIITVLKRVCLSDA